ncbi:MAG: hypothetical protein QM601_14070 [Pseudoxanthomonas sp.]
MSCGAAFAQSTGDTETSRTATSVTSTSNTTAANDTQRTRELKAVNVTGSALSVGGGYMEYQSAAKAVSTVSRRRPTARCR